jgi:hypothetical protein
LHMFYTGFDWLSDEEMHHEFPEDAVPKDLNFQDLDACDASNELTAEDFVDWLQEGHHSCDVAQVAS